VHECKPKIEKQKKMTRDFCYTVSYPFYKHVYKLIESNLK